MTNSMSRHFHLCTISKVEYQAHLCPATPHLPEAAPAAKNWGDGQCLAFNEKLDFSLPSALSHEANSYFLC